MLLCVLCLGVVVFGVLPSHIYMLCVFVFIYMFCLCWCVCVVFRVMFVVADCGLWFVFAVSCLLVLYV